MSFTRDPAGPATDAEIVTPSDANDLPRFARGLLLSADASVSAITAEGAAPITLPLVRGFNPISVRRVRATGTTAGVTIVALY
jgi:hypothetical protein